MSTRIPGNSTSRRAVFRRASLISLIALAGLSVGAWRHQSSQHPAAQNEGCAILGTVQDDHGVPLANAHVTLTSEDGSQTKSTQADGKFEFRGLRPGQHRITVEAAKFRKESVNVILRPDETYAAPAIKLTPSSLHVAVLDASSQPLGGVTVSLYAKDRGSVGQLAARSLTDDLGDTYFGRLPPGSYQLSATLRGYDEYRNDVFISPGITTEFPLQLLVAPVIPINEKAFARYTVPNLPSKNVRSIFQDSEGWMWFGTDKGVVRFNGADFKSSTIAGSGFEGLAGEDVRSIAEDRSGIIWLATARGVRRISKAGVDAGAEFDVRDARQVLVDSRGAVWIGASDGLFHVDDQQLVLSPHSRDLQAPEVRSLTEDGNGNIWIATSGGVSVLASDRVVPLDRWPGLKIGNANEPPVKEARSVFADAGGRVWIAEADGLALIDNGTVQRINPQVMREANALSSEIRSIGQDSSGRVWIALEKGGVIVYDPARRDSQRVNFLDRDHVAAFYVGREGRLWFATDNGVINSDFYSFVSFTTSRGLADNDVQAVVEPPGSRGRDGLWFLTMSGISRLDGERFVPVEGFKNISVRAAAFDRTGTSWFATEQGAFKWTGETLTQFNEGSGLASNSVQWVAATAGGSSVVFATSRGASIFRDGALQNIEALAGYDVRHVFEDVDGRLWFATARGVIAVNPASGERELIDASRGLADDDVRWITRFNDRLMIATRGGIQEYGNSRLTTLDGEPASRLFVDHDGYLWAGTDDGQVKKFFAFGDQVLSTVYSGEQCALTGNRINSISEDGKGRIWIATNKGAVRHIPITPAPAIQISLEVDGRRQPPSESNYYYVSYGRHRLSFRFTAVTMSGQPRFLYRLIRGGGGERWEPLPAQQGAEHDVSRLDLDEGEHTFELIALNRDLYGSQAPPTALVLRVGLPFWRSWWFYSLAVAIVGVALGAIFAVRRAHAREYVLPRELRSYLPIEPNPFIVGNPIRTEKMFYGREDDFRYVRTKLEGTSQGIVIVFCGERRVGKSSILYQVAGGRLGKRFIPVFVDLQEMVIASDSEFFSRISRLIADAVARADAGMTTEAVAAGTSRVVDASASGAAASQTAVSLSPRVSLPAFDGRNPYPVFLDFLDGVLDDVGDRTLLILMDEYELLEGKVDEGKLSTELFTFLAGLMDNKERLALIFTGSRRLEERDRKYWRELLRRSLFRKVGFLSEKDTVRLITEPVTGRVVYGRGVTDVVYRLTAGQPFYTQMICQNLVDYMNEHQQNFVTVAGLKQVIAEIVDNPLPQMIYTWDALSDDEKLALSLLGEALADGMEFASARDLRASVQSNSYPVHLSENTIRLTLEEMFRRELLEKDASEGFRFKIDLLRLWIHRSHSIWQVVKEVRTL